MPFFPDPRSVGASLRKWVDEDISKVSDRFFEIGRFLFGVSTGSIGILVTISKLSSPSHRWEAYEWLSVAAFFISSWFALLLILPKVHKVNSKFNIQEAHRSYVRRTKWFTVWWTVFWALGLGLGAFGLLSGGSSGPPF